jgi:alanyl-tRNA synthetase
MNSVSDIRKAFLDYFENKGHSVLPSSALVPHNDPTLMFTNAGMNQFKNIFTGVEKPPTPPRAATSQKCVRAGGKHNDLENGGYTARHHTFFEMLGNFSFGDYFKEEAISYAWELITKTYGLPKEKLGVTVYHTDDEAFELWKKIAGLPESKILRVPTKDNFWAMGDTGPCGPCSEIFYDHGAGDGEWKLDATGHDMFGERYVEIWNLVFMQFEALPNGSQISLPKPSIDTGMGLERLSTVLQGVKSNYEIDLFRTIIAASTELTGNNDPKMAASHRVIADHLRASSFLIADGVLPSNEGRGYVLRRIMRRAMRHAHMLGCKEPLMHKLVPVLVNLMGGAYPELGRAQAAITETLRLEEERFKQTLERGLKLLEDERANIKGAAFSGEVAFKLYDTYGFPLDLTQDILRADSITVDTAAFDKEMDAQRQRAREAHKGSGDTATSAIWFDIKDKKGATDFLGYKMTEAQAEVVALVKDGKEVSELKAGEKGSLIVNQTPFYGESGGQIGDTGTVTAKGGKAHVIDTSKPLDAFHVHAIEVQDGTLKIGDTVELNVDVARRNRIRANHSATHLLHAVLRKHLGEHITQKGSLVAPDRLRFDVTNPKAISREELNAAEAEVNRLIFQDSEATTKLMTPDDAIKAGAMALFGEKYGAEVRVLSMGENDYSVELCGGTHVSRTGEIGLFKITSEGSVSSGVRRIEATTGEAVRTFMIEQLGKQNEQLQALLKENTRLLGELKKTSAVKAEAPAINTIQKAALKEMNALFQTELDKLQLTIQSITDENKKLTKELAESRKQAAMSDAGGGEAITETIGNFKLCFKVFGELDAKSLRDLANNLQKQHEDSVVVVASQFEGKANIIVAVGKNAKADAPALVRAASAAVGGQGGGGKPDFAQAGGPEGDKLDAAIAAIKSQLAA